MLFSAAAIATLFTATFVGAMPAERSVIPEARAGAYIKMCTGKNLGGFCETYPSSQVTTGACYTVVFNGDYSAMNDKIRSLHFSGAGRFQYSFYHDYKNGKCEKELKPNYITGEGKKLPTIVPSSLYPASCVEICHLV
ncbi:hypothetical protein BV22DRAFT_1129323 [Leucogyrophana mollusca]|uniref:Uncharacterized protein n=1 Tax=Leucogyrophana mollusca TaxID=85980 RepID=A0ACB8BGR5_9AGAM|nr:hypothetical protein BV22DRAFT_1129323 [Leucogyrophana mollusca]